MTARRQRIVDAAARLFERASYVDVRMDAIAAEASVAKPTLYRYFPTKELLFVEALEQTLTRLCEDIEAVRAGRGSPEEHLRRMVALVLERVGRLAPAIEAAERASVASAERSRRILRQGFRNLRRAVGAVVEDGAAEGRFRSVNADLATLMILGSLRMTVHVQPGLPDIAGAMADLFLNGLHGRAEASASAPRLLGAVA